MNNTDNGNQPAYPQEACRVSPGKGLTKREAFAMAALTGLCSRLTNQDEKDLFEDIRAGSREAKIATQLADALLAELSKEAK